METLKLLQKQLLLIIVLLASSMGFSYADTPFITIWKTDNAATNLASTDAAASGVNTVRFRVPVTGGTFSGSYIKVGADESTRVTITNAAGGTDGYTITTAEAGEYELTISSTAGAFVFNFGNSTPAKPYTYKSAGDRLKITNIKQWGDIYTFAYQQAFSGCQNLDITATDAPKLSGSMAQLFKYCDNLVGTASFTNWDLTNVTAINGIFLSAKKFNQSLAGWNLKNVTNITGMFDGATALSCNNFSLTIKGWADNADTPTGLGLSALPTSLKYYNDQSAYNTLFTTKAWSYTGKGTANELQYAPDCVTPLPVTFAGITASISNKQLLVKWKTVSEHNNDKFIVYISNNGKDWKETGTVKTKAENGNSNQILDYEYTVNTNNLQLASISLLAALISVCLLFSRRKRLAGAVVVLFGIAFFASCTKNELALQDYIKDGVYVKVTQIDKDGKTTSDSDIVYVKDKK